MIYCNAYKFIRSHAAPGTLLCKPQVAADLRAFAESQGIPHEALCRALSDRYEREQTAAHEAGSPS